jgi:hypothetical protein
MKCPYCWKSIQFMISVERPRQPAEELIKANEKVEELRAEVERLQQADATDVRPEYKFDYSQAKPNRFVPEG